MNLPDLGSVVLGITDVRKESSADNKKDAPVETMHTYDFSCVCNKCIGDDHVDKDISKIIDEYHYRALILFMYVSASNFDLRSTFPGDAKYQKSNVSVDTVYDSFTLALMSKRKFDLRATIIIYEADRINNRYLNFFFFGKTFRFNK